MPTLDEIFSLVKDIQTKVEELENSIRIDGSRQIVIHEGLSDISESLGTISAGEFRTGKGVPGKGFTGVRMAYPSLTYDGVDYVLVGVDDDTLQFGLNVEEGVAVFGGGIHKLTEEGYIIEADTDNRPHIQVRSGQAIKTARIAGYAVSSDQAGFYYTAGIYYDGSYWQPDPLVASSSDHVGVILNLSGTNAGAFQIRSTVYDVTSDIPSSDLIVYMEGISTSDGYIIRPGWESTVNLGDAVSYWNDISYKTLTDRGCLGWYDEGVKVGGKKMSDMDALKSIRPHPHKKTPAGRMRLDYKTLPDDVYKPAKIATKDIYREPDEMSRRKKLMFKKGEKMGEDGAELTALVSIMLGAIKELDSRMENLEDRIAGEKK